MKKIDINKENRLKAIFNIALMIQDTKQKKIGEIRRMAHEIEILADTDLLKQLNKSIKQAEIGNLISLEELDGKI